jgi:hypothetical protein
MASRRTPTSGSVRSSGERAASRDPLRSRRVSGSVWSHSTGTRSSSSPIRSRKAVRPIRITRSTLVIARYLGMVPLVCSQYSSAASGRRISCPRSYQGRSTRFRLDLANAFVQNGLVIRGFVAYTSIFVATLPALFGTRREQAVVELALRRQLAIYAQSKPRPPLAATDRRFWIALRRFWPRWRNALVIVQPLGAELSLHLLREYVDYDNADRVHTELQDSPNGRPTEHRPSSRAQVIGLPRVGGLHHRYEWQEAA